MILRIDDTDADRNTQASLDSIFEGLKWLDLGWDEFYHQSDRVAMHREAAMSIFRKGMAYRDFSPAESEERSYGDGPWLFRPQMREMTAEESDRRAAAGEPFVLRFRVPRTGDGAVAFADLVYGPQSKAFADIEDFALLRSNGIPTYHMASCTDDADLRISHIIRGQDHLTNTFKHVLIFEALGVPTPKFAHLPLLIAPDGSKLSKRKHGPVVSVTTYRDGGFLPHAFVNFLCLLGWSPKDDREKMSREELQQAFTLDGVNRSNAVVNFSEDDPFDPKAVWLNAEHLRALPVDELARRLEPFVRAAGLDPARADLRKVAPLVRERIRLLKDVAAVGDFFFAGELPPYAAGELIPQKGDAAMSRRVLESARSVLAKVDFEPGAIETSLREAAAALGVKAGQMFQPIRVAVCGRRNAPPLFETIEALGRERCLHRIDRALELLG